MIVAATAGTLAVGWLSLGRSPQLLPSPEEANRQAEQLSPEELTNLSIDAELRDRLRFDPAWQPIARSVRQDLMILKWGNNQLANPVWQRYGARAYPLLAYYARSADPTRQTYGVVGIRSLGKPYTTLWLEQQLQHQAKAPDFYLVTGNPALVLDPTIDAPYEWNWQPEFGLDDPETRDRLIRLAQDYLEPETSPDYYSQFNLSFLTALLGYEELLPPQPAAPSHPALDPALDEWNQLEQRTPLTTAQIQQAINIYRNLSPQTQEYFLVTRLGEIRAGEISALGAALLRHLATNPESSEQVWAIAELNRHGDPQGRRLLQTILNGDLTPLHTLTRAVSYGFFPQTVDWGTHAYYLLVGMAEQYPQSRFIRASKEYGELRGIYYFGGEPRSETSVEQAEQTPAAQREQNWQTWLNQYSDHPGADDATYFLARSLQDQNKVMEAMEHWIALMTQPIGDGDAAYLAYPHVRSLLDVGLTTDQLATVLEQHQNEAIAPLFQYALAVHQARAQDYAQALQTSNGLNFAPLQEVLERYYGADERFGYAFRPNTTLEDMQTLLAEQRQKWHQLQQLQATNTPQSRYELASNWAGEGGWKNGYLAVWDDGRTALLPTGDWSNYYCTIFWVCNQAVRSPEAVRLSYQQGSQNAIALSLYQKLLDDPNIPASMREKAIYMATETLLWQWEDHPLGETFRIHPPAGVKSTIAIPDPTAAANLDYYDEWQSQYDQYEQDYLNALNEAIEQLQRTFPQSVYIDDLLFSKYALSGQLGSLEQIVQRYPNGDRAEEAQFLINHRHLHTNPE